MSTIRPTSMDAIYTPVVQGYVIEPYVVQGLSVVNAEIWGIINSSKTFTVRQHVKFLPKNCCACPPCVKQPNSYSVYAGMPNGNQAELLRIDEVSDDWNRCCCAPYHPLMMEVRQHIPMPGDPDVANSSDFAWLTRDFAQTIGGLQSHERSRAVNEFYKQQPVLITMLRDDGMRCCCKCPCKCLDTFVCFRCCEDGMHVYEGPLPPKMKEIGRYSPEELQGGNQRQIGSVHQPQFAGWCIPTLHLRDGDDTAQPFGKVEGPLFFGGWIEFCCDFKFYTSFFNSKYKAGDAALITKKRPANCSGMCAELCSEADVYVINYEDKALNPQQKVTTLSSLILADYMYFDGTTQKCASDDNNIYCYCCYCSIIGALIPCYIAIPTSPKAYS
jgi:hypothetical protein